MEEERELRATDRRDTGVDVARSLCAGATAQWDPDTDQRPRLRRVAGWLSTGGKGRSGEFNNLSMRPSMRARRADSGGSVAAPPGGIVVRFVTTGSVWSASADARERHPWSAWSAWPHHPAILPPLPRFAKSSAPDSSLARSQTHEHVLSEPRGREAISPVRTPLHPSSPVLHGHSRLARGVPHRRTVENLEWPERFDDWMIDIVRRRALRLNSGARRRGVTGSVRAVELAHILDKSVDAQGRWICALCREPVTLTDLSFDHVLALADGGEHAAHNLVPAHRKCNEIKGSEKAQYRAQALDRWLGEWATSHNGATPSHASRYPVSSAVESEDARRYA